MPSRSSFLAEYLAPGPPSANTLHESAHVVSAFVTINLVANTLHVADHAVAGTPAINTPASTLHATAHSVTAEPGISAVASSLHAVDNVVAASVLANVVARTLHESLHIQGTSTPVSLTAGTLHSRLAIVQAASPSSRTVNSLHIVVHITPNRLGYGVIKAVVVPLTVSDPYNPQYEMSVGATPQIAAALLEGSPAGVSGPPQFSGTSASFSMYELGGDEIFNRAASIDDSAEGKVHYQMQSGDTTEAGRFLARFHLNFVNGSSQDFPEDRYMEILID